MKKTTLLIGLEKQTIATKQMTQQQDVSTDVPWKSNGADTEKPAGMNRNETEYKQHDNDEVVAQDRQEVAKLREEVTTWKTVTGELR